VSNTKVDSQLSAKTVHLFVSFGGEEEEKKIVQAMLVVKTA
jgi:hypothetical protein